LISANRLVSGQGIVKVLKSDGSDFGYVATQANAYGEYGVTTNASQALIVIAPYMTNRDIVTTVSSFHRNIQYSASHKLVKPTAVF
jgi:hypothetical protein